MGEAASDWISSRPSSDQICWVNELVDVRTESERRLSENHDKIGNGLRCCGWGRLLVHRFTLRFCGQNSLIPANVFPSLFRTWRDYGSPELGGTHLGVLASIYAKDGVEFELKGVDESLAALLPRVPIGSMQEQARALFAQQDLEQGKREFEKASTELCALAECARLGLLHGLGWPPGNSDTPPFDLQIDVGKAYIPVDVKSANGSGFQLVARSLSEVVEPWAAKVGVKAFRVVVRYTGLLSQPSTGPEVNKRGALEDFAAELSEYDKLPDCSFSLCLQQVQLTVRIVLEESTLHQSGGIQGTEALARVLASSFEVHVTKKSQQARKAGKTPFLLMYVQLPGYGSSDIKTPEIFCDAMRRVSALNSNLKHDGNALWLGSVLLRPSAAARERYCCLRTAAQWPDGLSSEEFANYLKATLSLI
jgi:hypothetical protein